MSIALTFPASHGPRANLSNRTLGVKAGSAVLSLSGCREGGREAGIVPSDWIYETAPLLSNREVCLYRWSRGNPSRRINVQTV